MKDQLEVQTAWDILILIERLDQLLWDRYEDDFSELDPYELDDPCLGPLGPLAVLNAQDNKEA